MDQAEALHLLLDQLERFRAQSYDQLVNAIGCDYHIEITGDSGERYQVEIDARWDSRAGGDVRVIGSIDDWGWNSVVPFSLSFLKKPNETYVTGGEASP
jgi:hypothetical protein